jgi:protein-tyrosine-phosphatase
MSDPGKPLDAFRNMSNKLKPLVLILCTGNSCQSQIAEGILRASAGEIIRVESAGSAPTGQVHPLAIKVMNEVGIDISAHRSKHLSEFLDTPVHTAISVCGNADQACPMFPGMVRRYHWALHRFAFICSVASAPLCVCGSVFHADQPPSFALPRREEASYFAAGDSVVGFRPMRNSKRLLIDDYFSERELARRVLLTFDESHPLTAPERSPEIKYFCTRV